MLVLTDDPPRFEDKSETQVSPIDWTRKRIDQNISPGACT